MRTTYLLGVIALLFLFYVPLFPVVIRGNVSAGALLLAPFAATQGVIQDVEQGAFSHAWLLLFQAALLALILLPMWRSGRGGRVGGWLSLAAVLLRSFWAISTAA